MMQSLLQIYQGRAELSRSIRGDGEAKQDCNTPAGTLESVIVENTMAGAPVQTTPWHNNVRVLRIASLALWIIPMIVITLLVAHNPWKRTVTHLYHEASVNWWSTKDLYQGPSGMNYLPHFGVLFTPFHLLPVPVGDIIWRWIAATLLAGGIFRLVRQRFGTGVDGIRAFALASVVALPLALPALRNGQANAMFAGLTLQAAAALASQQWWRGQLWIILALVVKPLGIVLALLAPAVYAPLRWRTVVGLAALAVFPFLFGNWNYVAAQHRELMVNLQSCAAVTEHRFADINGIIRTFGAELPVKISKLVRVLAGGVTLALWWFGARRLTEPRRGLWLLALTTSYLMLFNPMNEANSYVIAAPAFALWAAYDIGVESSRWRGFVIALIALSMGCLPNLVRPLFGNQFALIWHPLMTLLFVILLASGVWRYKPNLSMQPATA